MKHTVKNNKGGKMIRKKDSKFFKLRGKYWGGGGLNLPLSVPFNPIPALYLLAHASLHFFDCQILHNVA